MAGEGRAVDDLRFDVEWHCPECGHETREENVRAPGVSWTHCPVCWGRMYPRLTQHDLAIQSQEGGGDGG